MFEESEIASFVKEFEEFDINRISFAWNGKHAEEFVDTNHAFRAAVTEYVVRNPAAVSVALLRALFKAHAECAVQAWGSPYYFAEIGALLLSHGGSDAVDDFVSGFVASFDTFAACHSMSIDALTLKNVSQYVDNELSGELSDERRRKLEATQKLFGKLKVGTALESWVVMKPGTEVNDIHIVKGKGFVWLRIKEAVKRLFAKS